MADIPLPDSNTDIYSLGFSKSLQRGIPDNSTGVVYDTIENSLNTGSVLSGGNLNLKTLSIGGLVRQVAPGDDIQAAIDAINREGGGTVQLLAKTYLITSDIFIKSNVRLVGAGKELTIIDCSGSSFRVRAEGTLLEGKVVNFSIENLTVKSCASNPNINVSYASNFVIQNVASTLSGQEGIAIRAATFFLCTNSESTSNTGSCWLFQGTSLGECSDFTVINCTGTSSGASGFKLNDASSINTFYRFTFLNCTASSNGTYGFEMSGVGGSTSGFGRFVGNYASGNSSSDFFSSTAVFGAVFVGNYVTGSNVALSINSGDNLIVGNYFNETQINDTSSAENLYVGNVAYVTAPGSQANSFSSYAESSSITSSIGTDLTQDRDIRFIKNTSGATMKTGAVVVHKSVTAGNEYTTTSTNGDDKVIGCVVGGATSDNSFSRILTRGKTTLLLANNSASSISVGDFLSTYSHAYYAKKAIAGETSFAIALEAPTTSTAVIDALLISPRLI